MLSINKLIALEEIYTKEELEKGLFKYVKQFYLGGINFSWADTNTAKIIALLRSKTSFSKTEMVTVTFSVFGNETIYKAFITSLPPHIPAIIEKLLWCESISDAGLEKLLGKPVTINVPPSKAELDPEYYIFSVKEEYESLGWGKIKIKYILSIPDELKTVLKGFYKEPAHYSFVPMEIVPETRFRFNAHPAILEELPRIISYYNLGNIKYSTMGKPVESNLGKFQKTCSFKEFYPDENESPSKVRSNLLAGMMYGTKPEELEKGSMVETIKHIFQQHYFHTFSSQYIVNQLKGWGYLLLEHDKRNGFEEILFGVFKDLPLNNWVSIINLLEYIEYKAIRIKPLQESAAQNKLYYEDEYPTKYTVKSYITDEKYSAFIKDPFIKGTIFLYAAFGLMEIAFASVNTTKMGSTYYSLYDGLMYFKLTPLGAYVLDISPTYDYVVEQPKIKFTLSHDTLMVITEGDLDAAEVLLGNYAEKLGSSRYRVTTNCFLKECKNKKDIESKIALFKSTVNTSIPTFWERFFKQLLMNAAAIKQNKTVIAYTLPTDDKELHRLVAQDSTLKQFVLKAEGFNMLVTLENLPKFKTRMKELGFVIE